MLYALNLDPETSRVLSVTEDQYGAEGQPRVESFPDDNVSDYLYIDGEFVYGPLPKPEPEPDREALLEARITALTERNEFMEDCIAEMAALVYA